MTRLIELRAENFKRLKCITIRFPSKGCVVLNGENGSGKTSALDAIVAALGGQKERPEVPIRNGTRRASVRVTLDTGYRCELTCTPTGGAKLVVLNADGESRASPQTFCNEFYDKHTINPLKFANMDEKEQVAKLKEIVGLDFTEKDQRRAALYEERKEQNRTTKRLQHQLKELPDRDPQAPPEEVSPTQLMTEALDAEQRHARHTERVAAAEAYASENTAIVEEIEALQAKIERYRESLGTRNEWLHDEREAIATAAKLLPDLVAMKQRVASIEQTNASVRANQQRTKVERELDESETRSAELTNQIEAIDEEKAAELAAAHFPIEGLGFDDFGVTYEGLPLKKHASHAQQIRVSTAIAAHQNPDLRLMLIRDGEKLDENGMRLFAELAEEHDLQLCIERAGHRDPGGLVFEDGEIVETVEETA